MITTTYGYKKPEDGEQGDIIFSALNGNTDLLNNHSHNGTNSAAIASSSLSRGLVTSGSWTSVSNGFKQTIICPGAYTLSNCNIRFRISLGDGLYTPIFPTITPVGPTSFEITVCEELTLEVLFT